MISQLGGAPSPAPPKPACSAVESLIGRRGSIRHPLDIAGRFIFGDVNVRVQLEDISASGAAFRLMHSRPLEPGKLCWLGFECYGEVLWQADGRCGLRFTDRLPDDCLRRTLDFGASAALDRKGKLNRLASAWVHGPGDY